MNQRKWELHTLKGVNAGNHGARRMSEDSSDLLLFSFFNRRLFLRADLHEPTHPLTGFTFCIHPPAVPSLLNRVMRAFGAVAFDPSCSLSPPSLSPVPLTPACLSYYRASRGGLVLFHTWKFVCPSARRRSPRRPVCSAAVGGRLRGEVMEEEALTAGLSSLG